MGRKDRHRKNILEIRSHRLTNRPNVSIVIALRLSKMNAPHEISNQPAHAITRVHRTSTSPRAGWFVIFCDRAPFGGQVLRDAAFAAKMSGSGAQAPSRIAALLHALADLIDG